jgi:hypothetical protein
LHESPHTAANTNIGATIWMFSVVAAPVRPIAKSRESHGKKGVITKPVSQKITANSNKYVQSPSILM